MIVKLDTSNMDVEQVIDLFDKLGGDILDGNDELYNFRGNLIAAALETGQADLNEATGDLVRTDLPG